MAPIKSIGAGVESKYSGMVLPALSITTVPINSNRESKTQASAICFAQCWSLKGGRICSVVGTINFTPFILPLMNLSWWRSEPILLPFVALPLYVDPNFRIKAHFLQTQPLFVFQALLFYNGVPQRRPFIKPISQFLAAWYHCRIRRCNPRHWI